MNSPPWSASPLLSLSFYLLSFSLSLSLSLSVHLWILYFELLSRTSLHVLLPRIATRILPLSCLQSMEMELLLDDVTKPGAAGVDWGKVGRFAALVKREKDTG